MAEELLLPGGTSEIEDFYIGPERAFRVDTDNDNLRLHDGSKVGGFKFLNMDENDLRYQARQVELDGFNFGPQQRGFPARVGPGIYRLRQITVNPANMTIVNPFGILGDPLLSVAPDITDDHTFSGDITFVQPLIAQGGVVGDLIGNVTGDVAGNLTGNVTGDVTGNLTGGFDTRGATIIMDNNQIDRAWVNGLGDELVNRGLPLGAIIMWAGTVDDVPTTFALCDGDNGTPDLQNQFIVAAGPVRAAHSTGGSDSHTHAGSSTPSGEHDHSLTIAGHALTEAEMPEHLHGCGVVSDRATHFNHGTIAADPTTNRQFQGQNGTSNLEGITTEVGGGSQHTHMGSTADTGGAHTHPVEVSNSDNVPVYYALCFIMKVV